MNLSAILQQKLGAAFEHAGAPVGTDPIIKRSSNPEHGDYQANGSMAVAKKLGTNPREFAQRVVEQLNAKGEGEIFANIEVAGPGFINLHIRSDALAHMLQSMAADKMLGVSKKEVNAEDTVVIDYSGPNLAKEMHVGHLRSTIIGDALVRVLEHLGNRVIRQNHVGDWGTQFGMLITHMADLKVSDGVDLADLEGFYRAAKQRFDEDEVFQQQARQNVVKLQAGDAECLAMWQTFIGISLEHCETLYTRLQVQLTRADVHAESAYNEALPAVIAALDEQGLLSVDDGAKCVFLPEFKGKDGEALPAIVQKSDGGYLYATTDLAALKYRQSKLHATRIMYFVDARQSLHFQQMFAIAKKAAFVEASTQLEHSAFGAMLGKDGKPFKTREGGTVKLADLLDEAVKRAHKVVLQKNTDLDQASAMEIAEAVGIGAVKYADLSKTRTADYVFDWEAMLSFEGNTAPYMMYAYARMQRILEKGERNLTAPMLLNEAQELRLAHQLLQFNDTLVSVADKAMPHLLCAYLFDLANALMSFYEACPILKAEADIQQSRLQLIALSSDVLKTGMELLGIPVLKRM